jgi:MFS family permease
MAAASEVTPLADGPEQRVGYARWRVLFLLCSMSFVLYLDRVCISQAIAPIGEQFGLSNTQKSLVLMAFTLAYGLFEMPTGHWGDRYGARRVLTRVVVWWSIFTMLTAGALGFSTLVLIRFLFGAGEAGAFPNAARIMATWFPMRERGVAQAAFLASSLLGGTIAPVAAAYLIGQWGWRWPFIVFGLLGWVWALIFFWWFRDDPGEHSAVNAAELRHIKSDRAPPRVSSSIPWSLVFRHRTIWLLGLIITCGAFNSYLYFSWYSNYLQSARGVSNELSGWLSGMVLAGGALGQLAGGSFADWVRPRLAGWMRRRKFVGSACYASAAIVLLVSVRCQDPAASAGFAALSCLLMFSSQSIWWSCTTDVSGRHVGSLFGLANGLGVIGAMGSQFFFGAFTDWRKTNGFEGRLQWDPAMYVVAGVLLFGATCWLFVNPVRTVEGEELEPSEKAADGDSGQI